MEKQIGRAKEWSPASRGCPFRVGSRYMTTKWVRAFPPDESLPEGEIVVYQGSAYSFYDSLSLYAFVSESGQDRSWSIHDDEPMDLWRGVFVEL